MKYGLEAHLLFVREQVISGPRLGSLGNTSMLETPIFHPEVALAWGLIGSLDTPFP